MFPQVQCLLVYSLNMFNVYSTSLHPVFKHSVHPLKCWHCLAQPWTTSSFLPTLGFFHSWPSSCITASLCLNIFPINLDGTASNRAEKKGCKRKRSDPKYRAPLLLLRLYVTVVPQPVLLLRQLEFLPWSDGNAKKKKKNTKRQHLTPEVNLLAAAQSVKITCVIYTANEEIGYSVSSERRYDSAGRQ